MQDQGRLRIVSTIWPSVRAERRIRIRLVMYLGEDGGTQNVPIWEYEPFGGPE